MGNSRAKIIKDIQKGKGDGYIQQLFDKYDKEKKGYLIKTEALSFFGELYDCLSLDSNEKDTSVKQWFAYFDGDKNGRITAAEFERALSIARGTISVGRISCKKELPYGAWESTITPQMISNNIIKLSELFVVGDFLFWLKKKPNGRTTVMQQNMLISSPAIELIPNEYDCGNRVNEMGGGSYCVEDNFLYFTTTEGKLYKQNIKEKKIDIIPTDPNFRFADLVKEPKANKLWAVGEDHSNFGYEPSQHLIRIDIETGAIEIVATGNDFYSSPRINSTCDQIAFITWNSPGMPWEGTELWIVSPNFSEEGIYLGWKLKKITGGKHESISQPLWRSGDLFFLSNRTGWGNIYRYDVQKGVIDNVAPMQAECSVPCWRFRESSYTFLSAGELLCCYFSSESGQELAVYDDLLRHKGKIITLPYTHYSYIIGLKDGKFATVCGGPTIALSVTIIDPWSLQRQPLQSSLSDLNLDFEYFNTGEWIDWIIDNRNVKGFYQEPLHPLNSGPKDEKPPLIVKIHEGPAGWVSTVLDLENLYWTSRGFALLHVEYTGSWGYGRDFEEMLLHNWGKLDVDDCCAGALALVKMGRVDPNRLIISGSRLAGYTALRCANNKVFHAAVCHSGISEIEQYYENCTKFISGYIGSLITPIRNKRRHILQDMYPLYSFDTPLFLSESNLDEGSQSTMIFEVLSKSVPITISSFSVKDEYIGVPLSNLLQNQLSFFASIFGIPLENKNPIQILNLENWGRIKFLQDRQTIMSYETTVDKSGKNTVNRKASSPKRRRRKVVPTKHKAYSSDTIPDMRHRKRSGDTVGKVSITVKEPSSAKTSPVTRTKTPKEKRKKNLSDSPPLINVRNLTSLSHTMDESQLDIYRRNSPRAPEIPVFDPLVPWLTIKVKEVDRLLPEGDHSHIFVMVSSYYSRIFKDDGQHGIENDHHMAYVPVQIPLYSKNKHEVINQTISAEGPRGIWNTYFYSWKPMKYDRLSRVYIQFLIFIKKEKGAAPQLVGNALCKTSHSIKTPLLLKIHTVDKKYDNATLSVDIEVKMLHNLQDHEKLKHELVSIVDNYFDNYISCLYDLTHHQHHEHDPKNLEFKNWGMTIKKTAGKIFYPKTRQEVIDIVNEARKNNRRVRGSGYRHTWSDLYIDNDDYVISFVPPGYDQPPTKPNNHKTELTEITNLKKNYEGKPLIRVGAATTNTMLRDWCDKYDEVTISLNVIMVEITLGGSNAPICHGSGWQHPTLSDLVFEIEFVNSAGVIQTINKVDHPELIKSASGAFGLIGITLSIVLMMEPMSYAMMHGKKEKKEMAIPPPWSSNLEWIEKFEARCRSYYAEWFWFCGSSECWVNCWNTTTDKKHKIRHYPTPLQTKLQQDSTNLARLIYEKFPILSDKFQTKTFGTFAMLGMPTTPEKTPVSNAVHFRQGIHNFIVWDVEVQIPIYEKQDGTPDWSYVQRAWWDWMNIVIDWQNQNKWVCKGTLEMRVMKASEVTMAPQNFEGKAKWVCSIEALTMPWSSHPQFYLEDWKAFCQALVNKISTYTDPKGNPIPLKFHWTKQWDIFKVRNMDYVDYAREFSFKNQIKTFKTHLAEIAALGGTTYENNLAVFSNRTLRRLLED